MVGAGRGGDSETVRTWTPGRKREFLQRDWVAGAAGALHAQLASLPPGQSDSIFGVTLTLKGVSPALSS